MSGNRGKQRGENLVTMSVTIPQKDLADIDIIVLKRKLETRDYNRSALVSSIIADYLEFRERTESNDA